MRLRLTLDITRRLYNALLQQRRDAYRLRRKTLTAKEQYAELTATRADDPQLRAVYRESLDAVLRRLDLAFAAFFRRIKAGEKAGYPRFKPALRWQQLQFPHGDRALKFNEEQTRVYVPGVGALRLRKGRRVPVFKRAWLVCKNGRWYACFECERGQQFGPHRQRIVGIDRGVHVLAATSDGRLIANPRPLQRHRRRVERLQRTVARRKRGGRGRRKAVTLLARAHERVANARRDSAHKIARRLVESADIVAIEKLNTRAMTRSAKGTIEQPAATCRRRLPSLERCSMRDLVYCNR